MCKTSKWSLQLRHLRQNILSGPLEITIIESPGDPSRSSTVPGITSTFRMLSSKICGLEDDNHKDADGDHDEHGNGGGETRANRNWMVTMILKMTVRSEL